MLKDNKYYILLICNILILINGCCNHQFIRQKNIYFKNNQIISSYYSIFELTSIEDIKKMIYSELSNRQAIINIINNHNNDNNNLLLEKYINKLLESDFKIYLTKLSKIEQIEKNIVKGDEIYRYIFKYYSYQEEGIIILNNGELRLKYMDIIFNNENDE